jgi:glucose-1-phosphate cytidylyltransferase
MKVVLLAGGLGTRLREETEVKPKPMVEVGGRPILWHIMKTYASYGHTDFVICAGYKGEVIKNWFANFRILNSDFTVSFKNSVNIQFHSELEEMGWNATIADTGAETMTGGRIKKVAKYVGKETFLCTYGDGLADVDIAKLMEFHKSHGKIATLTTVKPVSRFGVLEIGASNQIESFKEKPQAEGFINGGFFVFEPEIFDYLNEDCVLEQEPLRRLAEEGQLMAFHHEGFWQPMDTFRELTILNELWKSGNAPWKVWQP